ncbi:DNA polymerase I [Nicoliella spurrieriana]|uniref:DNA polymerase I n=1 Tax=Nicoliella spurrieriana TaxID=2925830 RepID=A0A976X5I8_9LACO|nr:DNA polymerase I [Nicoliella spurrieriana]UQS86714.1 DNA polymerase I [Nicoliella spurrieriana]
MAEKRLLLIDGNSIAFKAFYALYQSVDRFTNQDGLHTSAIYGFNTMLDNMLSVVKPTAALAAFDAGKVTFRTKMFKEYKGGRRKTPDELIEQFPYIKKLLTARGIKSYQLPNYEADDIIGTIAKQAEADGYLVTIVTGDRDLTQLCSDRTTVSISKTGVSQTDHYTAASVKETMGITPQQIIDVKGLQGDSSDNYPGVNKVGPKTADKLIKQFGSIENLYEHLDEITAKKLKEHLIEDHDQALLSKRLATIDRDAPLTIGVADLAYQGDQIKELTAFYQQMNFRKFLSEMGASADEQTPKIEFTRLDDENLTAVNELGSQVTFYLAMDGDNYHTAPFVGFVISDEQHCFVSRNVALLKQPPLKSILTDAKTTVALFDAKRAYVGLHRLGIELNHVDFDMLLVSYLLNTNDNSNDLSKVASKHGYYHVKSDEAVYGKGAKRSIPDDDDRLFNHLAAKALAITTLKQKMLDQLAEHDQTKLYTELELPIAFVLARMEIAGITVNRDQLMQMGSKLSERIAECEQAIYNEAGTEFNIGSPKQLGAILFDKLNLPVIKRTKTGYSTSVDVLEQLAPQAPIVDNILKYRQLSKIASTYVDGLLKVIDPDDNKVHTRYLQTLTQTGRLSSVDPNLQNIPIRTEEGRQIRRAFVPSHPGWQIFSSDYSQIELRVLASISGDTNMQDEFLHNDDIHASTARRIFGLKSNAEVTPELRRQAKAVNFGIVYGISDFGLAKNTGITRKAAKQFIERYFAEYPNVHKYMQDSVKQAHEQGYVETITHRRRYLPDINSRNFHLRSFAERTAMNSPIQGSAADIIKIAMINMERAIEGMQANMLLQIHDELVFEAPESEIPVLQKLVPKIMDSAVKLHVPLKVASHFGATWYDAK